MKGKGKYVGRCMKDDGDYYYCLDVTEMENDYEKWYEITFVRVGRTGLSKLVMPVDDVHEFFQGKIVMFEEFKRALDSLYEKTLELVNFETRRYES